MTDGGIFTIGEVDSDWSNVTNQPKLPVFYDEPQWAILMDKVIVNGNEISGHGLL